MSDLKILTIYKDNEIEVIDKPTGISIHNAEDSQNLIEILTRHNQGRKIYPVHRLDKETSGVQIFALSEAAAQKWSHEFQQKNVKKIYFGILRGNMSEAQGVWQQALTDKGEGRKNPAGVAKDRIPCETRYRVEHKSKFFSLCEFGLITGRQHQIRKHAALAKHALVGDGRYGDQRYNEKIADLYGDPRLFLHCSKIEIKEKTFVSNIPESFLKLRL